MKTWKLTIEAVGKTQQEALMAALNGVAEMVIASHHQKFGDDEHAEATGKWEHGLEVKDGE